MIFYYRIPLSIIFIIEFRLQKFYYRFCIANDFYNRIPLSFIFIIEFCYQSFLL